MTVVLYRYVVPNYIPDRGALITRSRASHRRIAKLDRVANDIELCCC